MGRFLVIVGLLTVVVGVLWPWLSKLGLGRLPGDIRIESESLLRFRSPRQTVRCRR